jgi:hypothetical protein
MTSHIYRGEISHIGEELFINYTLELPEEELASTSGYFMKGSPFRYTYFTVQRGAISQSQQTTEVYEIDHTTGNKTDKRFAALTWSSGGSSKLCLGLITGYTMPEDWKPFIEAAYFSCYVSAASVTKRGIGRNKKGQIDLHTSRIQDLDDALLFLYLPTLPAGVAVADLQVYINSHQAQQGVHHHPLGHADPPPPTAVTAAFNPDINTLVVGAAGQALQTGLYVVAKPIVPGGQPPQTTQQQPYGHQQA